MELWSLEVLLIDGLCLVLSLLWIHCGFNSHSFCIFPLSWACLYSGSFLFFILGGGGKGGMVGVLAS